MTVPPQWSGRWSARPTPEDGPATEFPGPYAHKAPESMTASALSRPSGPGRRQRLSAARLQVLGEAMNPRDRAILVDLSRFGFLTTNQLATAHFGQLHAADRICRRVLKRLADARLVQRVDRRIGGFSGGSSTSIWRLRAGGYRLVNDGRRVRIKEPSERFLDHRLATADCYAQLATGAHAGQLELVTVEPEPMSWRPYLGPNGRPETLKPDLYVVTAVGDYEDYWFCEIDRGTESLPTIQAKCAQYVRYRRTGREQASTGLFPVVLWVVPNDQRADQLRRVVTGDLFRITTSACFADTVAGGAA